MPAWTLELRQKLEEPAQLRVLLVLFGPTNSGLGRHDITYPWSGSLRYGDLELLARLQLLLQMHPDWTLAKVRTTQTKEQRKHERVNPGFCVPLIQTVSDEPKTNLRKLVKTTVPSRKATLLQCASELYAPNLAAAAKSPNALGTTSPKTARHPRIRLICPNLSRG